MKIDIIIPTYNSEGVLSHTLAALRDQVINEGWQPRVIVSDDGSRTSPQSVVHALAWSSPWREPVVVTGQHIGGAGARNRGLAVSDADIVIFLGADIILRAGALKEHGCFHTKFPDEMNAALGMVVWDPRLKPTPLMEWMVHGGPQNNFDALLGIYQADSAHFFYGSHLSIKRRALRGQEFPTIYTRYGWEDLDLGRMLAPRGLTLAVLHKAVGLHRHAYTAPAIQRRQYEVGQGATIYQRRYPHIALLPPPTTLRRLKTLVYQYLGIRWIAWKTVTVLGGIYSLPRLFLYATAAEFWVGWYTGEKKILNRSNDAV
ncbi:MAG: glycosyltransferase family 2 protein [Candidatus Andersenbacteria bacterium]